MEEAIPCCVWWRNKNCYLPLNFRVCHHQPSSNNSESNLILRPKTGDNICDGFVEADDIYAILPVGHWFEYHFIKCCIWWWKWRRVLEWYNINRRLFWDEAWNPCRNNTVMICFTIRILRISSKWVNRNRLSPHLQPNKMLLKLY